MTDADILAYVRASAALQGLALDEARALRVAQHMARTAHLAQLLDGVAMKPHDELAEIFRPLGTEPPSINTL